MLNRRRTCSEEGSDHASRIYSIVAMAWGTVELEPEVRDWLETTGWDKNSPPPALPEEVVARTRAKYMEAYEKLTGKKFE